MLKYLRVLKIAQVILFLFFFFFDSKNLIACYIVVFLIQDYGYQSHFALNESRPQK